MTGNDLRRLRLAWQQATGNLQTDFAAELLYAHVQRIVELEKRGRRAIPQKTAELIRLKKLDRYLGT
jgi:hypothetical protein